MLYYNYFNLVFTTFFSTTIIKKLINNCVKGHLVYFASQVSSLIVISDFIYDNFAIITSKIYIKKSELL